MLKVSDSQIVLFGALASLVASPVLAATVFVSDGAPRSRVGFVDSVTGEGAVLFSTDVSLLDISFSPTGELFGVTARDIVQIDLETGASTVVGPVNTQAFANPVGSNGGLLFDTDGNLFSSTDIFPIQVSNPTTGDVLSIQSVGFSSLTEVGDFALLGQQLFFTARNASSTDSFFLGRRDLTTGIASGVGPTDRNISGLAVAENFDLFGVADNEIFQIDPETGEAGSAVSFAGIGFSAVTGAASFTESGAPSGLSPAFTPVVPVEPVLPVDPVAPVDPIDPVTPITPADPAVPTPDAPGGVVPSPTAAAAGLGMLGLLTRRRRRQV